MPRINLLPWREAERKRKRQEFFLSIGAAIATAALVILVGIAIWGALGTKIGEKISQLTSAMG